MTYKVTIRKNATGEERTLDFSGAWPEQHGLYMWTLGNYGCDCNREIFFERAAGNGIEPAEQSSCGETRFSVPHVTLPDGQVVQIDGAGLR